jgi:hypothetical protein
MHSIALLPYLCKGALETAQFFWSAFNLSFSKMKLQYFFLTTFLLIITLSCRDDDDNPPPPPPVDKIAKEFRPYFDAFVEEMNARAPDSTIDFSRFLIRFAEPGELDSTVYGTCSRKGGDTILISRKNWEGADSVYREAVIFHELGHCALSRFHNDNVLRFYNCESLMNWTIGGFNCAADNSSPMWREYYLQELFELENKPAWLYYDTAYFIQPSPAVFYESEDLLSSVTGLENEAFQVELFFDSMTTTQIRLGDFRMEFKYNGWLHPQGNGNTKIYYKDRMFLRYFYLHGINWHEDTPLKFTFRFMKNQVFIYVNRMLIHNREAPTYDGMSIQVLEGGEIFDRVEVSKIL